MKKIFLLRILTFIICTLTMLQSSAYALKLSKVNYEVQQPEIVSDTLTRYTPWFQNFHLLTEEKKAAGKRGGMSAQRIICYDVSPIDTRYQVAGVDTNGPVHSTDGGKNWTFSAKGLKSRAAKDIAFDPYNEGVVYTILMASYSVYGDIVKHKSESGVFKSYDNGYTWEQVYEGITWQGGDVSDDLITFDEKGNVYVFMQEGVIKSADGGKNWVNIGGGLSATATAYNEGMWVSKDGKTVLTGSSEKGVVGTTDGGKNWKIYGPFVDGVLITVKSFAVDPDDSNHWYVTDGNTYKGQLFETRDGGETWQNLGMIFPGWKSDFSGIAFGAKNESGIRRMFISGKDTSRGYRYSDDGGKTWYEVEFNKIDPFAKGSYTSGPWHVDPNDDKIIYYASDTAICVSYDNGNTWHENTGGYSGHCVRNFSFDKNGYLYAAMHDFAFFNTNSPFLSDKNGDYPITVTMHDVINGGVNVVPRWNGAQTCGDVDVDPRDPNRILAAVGKYGDMIITESKDRGKTWKHIEATIPVNRSRVCEVNFHDKNPDTIYTSFFISRDNGVTWEPTPCMIYNVCETNNDYVTGYKDGKVWLSKDCGVTWTTVDVPSYSPWGMVYDIEDNDTVWMACQTGNVIKVSHGVVTVYGEENGLGDERLYQLAQNPYDPAHLLACGTPVDAVAGYGLFESYDYGENWHIVAGTDLGTADLYSVAFSPNERIAVVGSYMGTFIYEYDKYREYLDKNGDSIRLETAACGNILESKSNCVVGSLIGAKSSAEGKSLCMDFADREFKDDINGADLVLTAKLCAGGCLKVYSYEGRCDNPQASILIAEKEVRYRPGNQRLEIDISDYIKMVKETGSSAHLMIEFTVQSDRYGNNSELMNVLNAGGNGSYSPFIVIK